jgi:DNA invertase Pin-like site-specific DNA recombinase
MMLERQRESVAKAKAEKKYKGRAPTAHVKADQVRALDAQRVKKTVTAKELGISVRSVHRLLASANQVHSECTPQ